MGLGGGRGRLVGMKNHAGEADAAGSAIVEGLLVLEQAAPGRADRMQHRIGRGKTADAIAVAHAARPSGTSRSGSQAAARSSMWSSNELDLLLKPGIDRAGVAELGPDMAQVDPPDIGDRLAARRLGNAQRLDEAAHLADRQSGRSRAPSGRETNQPGSARSKTRDGRRADIAERQPETRSNARSDATARRQKSRGRRARRSDRHRAGRSGPSPGRVEIFACQSKPSPAVLVSDTQDDEGVGVGVLDELFVRPGIDRAARAESRCEGSGFREHSRWRIDAIGPAARRRLSRRKTARAGLSATRTVAA